MNDMSELLHDPDFVTDFTVFIAGGYYERGGVWVETLTEKTRSGVIQPAAPKDTQYLVDGDKSRQAIKIWSDEYLSSSDERIPKLGDKIAWHGSKYRIAAPVKDWSQFGYWQALAVQVVTDG